MELRAEVFDRLRAAFRSFGYGELDTPAFESLDLLTVKSGPAIAAEIYAFQDKGGRDLALRFEFTASLGRVMANNPALPRPFRRFQIGKVWRYERPQAGRFREFYQADADIIGSASASCEIELLDLIRTVLTGFSLNDYTVPIFHRGVLDALVQAAGIAMDKKGDVFRALDKLHKIGRDGVRGEFVERGLGEEAFERFFDGLEVEGSNETILSALEARVAAVPAGVAGVANLRTIVAAAEGELGMAGRIRVDPTLVRGLDYYTGVVFEAKAVTEAGIGSFAGGGRYDTLIETFGGAPEPACGFAFGVERLIEVLAEKRAADKREPAATADVYVAVMSDDVRATARRVADALRARGLRVMLDLSGKGLGKQFQLADKMRIQFVVPIGTDEAARDDLLSRLPAKDLKNSEQTVLSADELAQRVRA